MRVSGGVGLLFLPFMPLPRPPRGGVPTPLEQRGLVTAGDVPSLTARCHVQEVSEALLSITSQCEKHPRCMRVETVE